MPMRPYVNAANRRQTPQTEAIPGREAAMAENNAGGFSFVIDDWARLDRFLVLGAEGGTFYVGERKLARENAACVERCLKADGLRTVARIVEVSVQGRAPKNDPAVFALALALKFGDEATRKAASAAVPQVCRIGTHIFALAEAVKALGGWGRATRRAFAGWYTNQAASNLAHRVIKYQQRAGWSHRDLLRLCHAVRSDAEGQAVLRYAVKGVVTEAAPGTLVAFEALKAAQTAAEAARIVTDHGLPRECVPTQFLNDPDVWSALLHAGKYGMPLTALIRNLGKMTAVGLLKPLSDEARYVEGRLHDGGALRASRVHPMAVLLAATTYVAGAGVKGSLSWEPVAKIVDALNEAFYAAFTNVVPSNKRTLIGLGCFYVWLNRPPRIVFALWTKFFNVSRGSSGSLAEPSRFSRSVVSSRRTVSL